MPCNQLEEAQLLTGIQLNCIISILLSSHCQCQAQCMTVVNKWLIQRFPNSGITDNDVFMLLVVVVVMVVTECRASSTLSVYSIVGTY